MQHMTLLQHGSQNALLETMGLLFDLPQYGTDTLLRDKTCAANILEYFGTESVKEAKKILLDCFKNNKEENMKTRHGMDGAYFNVARHQSKICYMYDFCQLIGRVTGHDVLSILKQGHNVNPVECCSKQMEHKLAKNMIKELMELLESAVSKYEKKIQCQIVADKDIEWTTIVEKMQNSTNRVSLSKIDDTNHALKQVFNCQKEAKENIPKAEKRNCGLTVAFAEHVHRSFQIGLLAKPETFTESDRDEIIDHYFEGNVKHPHCPAEWCPKRQNLEYAPALARGYLNRHNNDVHARAYKEFKERMKDKFPEEKLKR